MKKIGTAPHFWSVRYAELLTQFKTINSIPILLDPENNFRITLRDLRREVVGRGLGALLLSATEHRNAGTACSNWRYQWRLPATHRISGTDMPHMLVIKYLDREID